MLVQNIRLSAFERKGLSEQCLVFAAQSLVGILCKQSVASAERSRLRLICKASLLRPLAQLPFTSHMESGILILQGKNAPG